MKGTPGMCRDVMGTRRQDEILVGEEKLPGWRHIIWHRSRTLIRSSVMAKKLPRRRRLIWRRSGDHEILKAALTPRLRRAANS
jgi:hypothetical protein